MTFTIKRPLTNNYRVSQDFGVALDWYIKIAGYPHNGIDYACPIGTPVYATDDGIVVYSDTTPDADGLGVNIAHSWGLSQYWHLSRVIVKYGQKVKRGEQIGFSGDTGWATGPHLHFGIKVTQDPDEGMRGWTNPTRYFENVTTTPTTPNLTYKTYVVRPGDSLWKIAEKIYGKGYLWPQIYSANKDKIQNPQIIRPLQILKIPTL